MAALTKSGTPTVCTVLPDAGERLGTFEAGEAIAAGDACLIASTGKVLLSNGAVADANALIMGWAGHEAALGEPVTLWANVNFNYAATSTTPGKLYYLSGTVEGGLVDAASTGGVRPCAIGLTGGRIRVLQVLETAYPA
jgi:hypothetical protein